MPDSIKKRIMDFYGTGLATMVGSGFELVGREKDASKAFRKLPVLQYWDGLDVVRSKGSTFWTCRFFLVLHVFYSPGADPGSVKDDLVKQIQTIIEADLTVNGLGVLIDGGTEDPSPSPKENPFHQTELRYTIEYTRKIGDPTALS